MCTKHKYLTMKPKSIFLCIINCKIIKIFNTNKHTHTNTVKLHYLGVEGT